ncbi:NEDD8 protease Nep2 [Linnemannia gamsii]|uniref:NEDD8 protease Nep2 n=1 Tax=Linnemannia gamsii TaxID=64522 RepID=A0ABQ7JZ89_9FUNG|nr:NEDD8 protease Nep2 [Linnemannia gamsii]
MVVLKIMHLVAIGIALGLVQAVPINNSQGSKGQLLTNKAICTTPHCVITAAGILNDMDPTADPCQDFSKFACGGFYDKTEIPVGKYSVTLLGTLVKKTDVNFFLSLVLK